MGRGTECFDCAYAERDRRGRYLRSCAGYAHCDFVQYEGHVESYPEDKMQKLIENANALFKHENEREAYVRGVKECLSILEEEHTYGGSYCV